jgi:hypothetical protein
LQQSLYSCPRHEWTIQVFEEQAEQKDHHYLSEFPAALRYASGGRAEEEEGEDFAVCEQLSPGCVPCN